MAIADLYQGNTKVYRFYFADANNTPIDITGWIILFTAKAFEADADVDAIIQVSTTAGDDPTDDPVNGLMYVTISSTDSNVTPQTLYYDFKRVIPGSPPDVKTLDKDTFSILKTVTISNS